MASMISVVLSILARSPSSDAVGGAAENGWVKFDFARRDFRVHIVDNNIAA
jgi:hypothetical protein